MMVHNISRFINDFSILFFILGIFGIIFALFSPYVKSGRLICGLFLFYTVFFNWRCNLGETFLTPGEFKWFKKFSDPKNFLYRGVIARFYLQSSIIYVIFIGITLNWIIRKFCTKFSLKDLTIYAYAISAILISSKYGANNYSNYNHVDSFGRVLVNSFPENSVILMKGRIKSFAVH